MEDMHLHLNFRNFTYMYVYVLHIYYTFTLTQCAYTYRGVCMCVFMPVGANLNLSILLYNTSCKGNSHLQSSPSESTSSLTPATGYVRLVSGLLLFFKLSVILGQHLPKFLSFSPRAKTLFCNTDNDSAFLILD